MSRNSLSIRLIGELPLTEKVNNLLGLEPSSVRRRGEPSKWNHGIMPEDIWVAKLVNWGEWLDGPPPTAVRDRVTQLLLRITPALNSLDRTRVHAELFLATNREEEMGGFDIPVEWVAAAAAARLQIVVSVLADLDDDEEDDATETKIALESDDATANG